MELEIEEYDYNKLNNIREQIENMSKFNQIEILRFSNKNRLKKMNSFQKITIQALEIQLKVDQKVKKRKKR